MLTISEEKDTNISVLGAEVPDDKDDNLGGDEVKLGGEIQIQPLRMFLMSLFRELFFTLCGLKEEGKCEN